MVKEKRLIDANALLAKVEKCTASKVVKALTFIMVHGRWIKVHEWCSVEVLKCSACGREHPRLPTAYCCDCGAKMDGGNEDGNLR